MRGDRGWPLARTFFVFVLLPSMAATAATEAAEVRFRVQKYDLKWTGPCSAAFFDPANRKDEDEPFMVHDDIAEPAKVPVGHYEVMLICPSTEGEFRQTQTLRVQGARTALQATLRPAFFLARVLRDGKEVASTLEVRDGFGRMVQQGRDKMALPVPPKKLRVTARVDSQVSGVQRPIGAAIEIDGKAGQKLTRTIDASDGTILVHLRENGRSSSGLAALRVPGSSVRVMEFASETPVPVPPGVYDVMGQLADSHDFYEVIQRRVEIPPGKKVSLTLQHTIGSLQPTLTFGGESLSAEEAEIQLFVKGALQAFNTIEPNEIAKLRPGKYRLVASLLDVKLDDGSAWHKETEVSVQAGKTAKVHMDLLPPTLQVQTQLGGKPTSLRVRIFRPGAEAPLVERLTPTDGTIGFRLPRGTYRVVASLPNETVGFVEEARIQLQKDAKKHHKFNLQAGRATIQVLDDGFAISAEVAFFAQGAAAPTRVARGGEQVYLPPGKYAVVVERRGQKYEFPPLELKAGDTVDKSYDLSAASSEHQAR